MTKEECERIKQAYSSGLKVQIWFDGHWKDFDIEDYSMFPEPFPEHRQYRIVGSAYADVAEKRIAELEKENEELETFVMGGRHERDLIFDAWHKEAAELKKRNGELAGQKASLERWFSEAKDLILKLSACLEGHRNNNYEYELLKEAERFLKEIEE